MHHCIPRWTVGQGIGTTKRRVATRGGCDPDQSRVGGSQIWFAFIVFHAGTPGITRFSMDLCRSAKRMVAKPGRSQRRDFRARPGVPGLLSGQNWGQLVSNISIHIQHPQDLRAKRDDADRQLSRVGATQIAPNAGPLHMWHVLLRDISRYSVREWYMLWASFAESPLTCKSSKEMLATCAESGLYKIFVLVVAVVWMGVELPNYITTYNNTMTMTMTINYLLHWSCL